MDKPAVDRVHHVRDEDFAPVLSKSRLIRAYGTAENPKGSISATVGAIRSFSGSRQSAGMQPLSNPQIRRQTVVIRYNSSGECDSVLRALERKVFVGVWKGAGQVLSPPPNAIERLQR